MLVSYVPLNSQDIHQTVGVVKNMPENNKSEEFLQKLAPCIERSDLDACVKEAAREMRVGAEGFDVDV